MGRSPSPPGRSTRAPTARRALLVAGLLAGAALLFRPDLRCASGLALGVLFLWALDGAGRRRLALGAALGVSPYLVHLALAGPGNVVRGMVLEPVFDLRPGRRLPFPPPHDEYTSFLNRAFAFRQVPVAAARRPPSRCRSACSVLGAGGGVPCCSSPSRCGPGGRAAPTAGGCWPSALFAAGLLPQAVQRADTAHLSWVSCVPLGLLPAFLAEAARLRGTRPSVARTVVLAPLALMLLFPHFTYRWYADYVGQSVGYDRLVYSVDHDGRSFYYGRQDVPRGGRGDARRRRAS